MLCLRRFASRDDAFYRNDCNHCFCLPSPIATPMSARMLKAFVLGAGLGTRLRPLTEQLPKPLVPYFHRPLIEHVFDHLLQAGVTEFVVNTHHLPEAYPQAFPEGHYRGARLTFRHEPVLLETGGGIANIADLMGDEPFLVYNGDILTDLPLEPLIQAHQQNDNFVTLALRTSGPSLCVAYDAQQGIITDILNRLGSGDPGTHQFTGVYMVSPQFVRELTPGKIESVVPVWLRLIQAGNRIGAVVIDDGDWCDLGDRDSYLDAHVQCNNSLPPLHPEARIALSAALYGKNTIGPNAVVGESAVLEDCILWPGAVAEPGANLKRCIIRSGISASGTHVNADF